MEPAPVETPGPGIVAWRPPAERDSAGRVGCLRPDSRGESRAFPGSEHHTDGPSVVTQLKLKGHRGLDVEELSALIQSRAESAQPGRHEIERLLVFLGWIENDIQPRR